MGGKKITKKTPGYGAQRRQLRREIPRGGGLFYCSVPSFREKRKKTKNNDGGFFLGTETAGTGQLGYSRRSEGNMIFLLYYFASRTTTCSGVSGYHANRIFESNEEKNYK